MNVLAPSPLFPVYPPPQVTFTQGRGACLYDEFGRSYIDLAAGIAVASVGHCHPDVVAAVTYQSQRLIHVSNLYGSHPQRALAERLAARTGGKLAFFCNSGAEAVECAIKLLRRWGAARGKQRVIAAEGSFHGRTLGALALTGQPSKREPFGPFPDVTFVPFGDAAALRAALAAGDVGGVILEPIQGEGGVVVPPEGYLTAARAACTAAGALLVLDEVQTGIGRTGRWFGYEHETDAEPDILCLAKGLGGGLPIGACLAAPDIAAAFAVGDHGSTFGGGPVQCAAAVAVLDVVERDALVERAEHLGRQAQERLRGLDGTRVRGRGLLIGIDLGTPRAADVVAAACARGALVTSATPHVIRLTPPLVITEAQLQQGLSILEEVICETAPS